MARNEASKCRCSSNDNEHKRMASNQRSNRTPFGFLDTFSILNYEKKHTTTNSALLVFFERAATLIFADLHQAARFSVRSVVDGSPDAQFGILYCNTMSSNSRCKETIPGVLVCFCSDRKWD